jgi:amino acid adenylation domain-containing protein
MFANTLVLRNFPGGDKTFLEFLNRVKTRTLEAFDNQEYQFEDLVDRLSIKRDAGRNPIFDAAFSLLDRAGYAGDNRVYHENAAVLQGNTARFDITLIGTDTGNDLLFTFEYRSALFKPATIERFIKYFRKIILELSVNTGQKIGGIEIISEAEKERLLYDFNDTKTGYPQDKTLHELFEEQAERSPAGTALVGSGQAAAAPVEKGAAGKKEKMHITYDVLNEKAGRLARSLKEKGIPAGSIVGIKIKRSIEMMAGIMGILKAGCAYLPIDPEYPEERIRFMQDDCGVKLTISAGDLTEDVETLRSGKVETVFAASRSAGLSYIIYTSGSTGQPKGVMVEHRNVSRVVKNTNYIDIRPQDIILQLSNYAFDGSMFDIFGALLNGASLVILAEDELLDIDKLSTVIEKEKITVFFLTTALFNVLVDTGIQCLGWTRSILFGGERVSVAHVKKALDYLGGGGRVIHMYGPTETVVYATYYPIHRLDDASATIPIGSPLANTTAYILDKYMKPVPIGVPGEIYIGGDSVSRGYLNDPELTAERFAPGRGHHVAGDKAEGMKLYKTGDLARRLPDGNIEFLERIDHQVKLRGFRVELGEIESRLSKDDAIKEALVSVKQDGRGEKCLCAYIVPDREERGEAAVDIPGIKKRLSQTLPGYMIPSYFVPLEKIPLNPNGKVDKKALPEPVMGAGEEYIAPANEIEKKLVEIWADVLNIDENVIGRDANFFELGGHSLNATLLLSKIHKELKVKISLADLFEMQSVEELASVIGIENWVIDQKTVEGEVMDEVVL